MWTFPVTIGLEIEGRRYGMIKRLQMFYEKGLRCVSCNRKATVAFLESCTGESPHLGFYIKTKKDYVKMTVDHIVPTSKGGQDTIQNMQPMCVHCNGIKGNLLGNLKNVNWLKLSKKERKQLREELNENV